MTDHADDALARPTFGTWIQTFTGKRFDFLAPHEDDVDLEDIAHSLSMQCRFNGHGRVFYSVAEHTAIVGGIVLLAKLSKVSIPSLRYTPSEDSLADARRLVSILACTLDTSPTLAPPIRYFLSIVGGSIEERSKSRKGLLVFPLLRFLPMLDDADRGEVIAAFMHDFGEAYAKDLPSPIKALLPLYKAKEAEIEACIYSRFGMSSQLPLSALIHQADREILFVERDALLNHKLHGWGKGIKRDQRIGVFAEAFAVRGLTPQAAEFELLAAATELGLK